eukprot:scaffold4482_cov133-Isochrysis_galbana.AAC.2
MDDAAPWRHQPSASRRRLRRGRQKRLLRATWRGYFRRSVGSPRPTTGAEALVQEAAGAGLVRAGHESILFEHIHPPGSRSRLHGHAPLQPRAVRRMRGSVLGAAVYQCL